MESNRQIEDAAASWLLKRDVGPWGERDREQLTEWLEASVANRVAFLRLEAAWEQMNRLKALGAGLKPRTVPSPEELRAMRGGKKIVAATRTDQQHRNDGKARRGRTLSFLAGAASVAAVAVGSYIYTTGAFVGDRYSTPIGAVTSVPLKDGSSITLNTASKIRVQLTKQERRIDLSQGEAFFEVAKDPQRPFIVQAGDKRVIAVGTKFSVRRDGDNVRVVVTEGIVRFEDASTGAVLTRDPPRKSGAEERSDALLAAGAVARASSGGTIVQKASLPEAEELLSWRSGYVVFHETALADAVAEFNRYNERKIVIEDPKIAAMKLTGKFRANNFETFVRLLEQSFPIETRHFDEQIVLTEAGDR